MDAVRRDTPPLVGFEGGGRPERSMEGQAEVGRPASPSEGAERGMMMADEVSRRQLWSRVQVSGPAIEVIRRECWRATA